MQQIESLFDIKFGFDLACTHEDAKAPNGYYFDDGVDALEQDWSLIDEENSFLNPPWKKITPFAKKCAELKSTRPDDSGDGLIVTPCTRIISLWNAGVGSKWFLDYVWNNAAVYTVQPRPTFIDPRTGKPFVSKKTGKPQTGLCDVLLMDWQGEPRTIQAFRWK